MTTQRKRCRAECKARMAFEALTGEKTINELASEYGVHPTQIAPWTKYLQTEGLRLFAARSGKREQVDEALKAQLYQQIGQLTVELDWLNKKLDLPVEAKRRLIEPAYTQISMARQCALLGVPRSSVYYRAVGESPAHLQLMRLPDEQ